MSSISFLAVFVSTILLSVSPLVSCFSPIRDDKADPDLFAWAIQNGATIDRSSIEMRTTDYGGRGIFAKRDIPAETELIRIPDHLQLGARQLAESTDEEMKAMARGLDWKYLLEQKIFFIPLSIAICAEQRKGTSSSFEPFLRSLSVLKTHSLAALATEDDNTNDLSHLQEWAPLLARMIVARRQGIQTIHQQLAPPSLTIEELAWAAINVCSRSLVRRKSPALSTDQVQGIGEFAASDRSRLLPIIDLVNHGSLQRANVWVGHVSIGEDGGDDEDANHDYSTSLKSKRDIKAGEELLFDYAGGDEQVSNERLLLDYGFVLPEHTDRVTMSMNEFVPVLMTLDEKISVGMKSISKEDKEGLDAFIKFLLRQAQDELSFASDGEPTAQTFAVAIALTCQGQDDVTRVLQPVRNNPTDGSLLPAQVVESSTEAQKMFAIEALKKAASMAFAQRSKVDSEACAAEKDSFANVARGYSLMCQTLLQKAAEAN